MNEDLVIDLGDAKVETRRIDPTGDEDGGVPPEDEFQLPA